MRKALRLRDVCLRRSKTCASRAVGGFQINRVHSICRPTNTCIVCRAVFGTLLAWLNFPLQRVTSPEPAKIEPSVFSEGVWCWCPNIYRTNPMSFHLAQVFLAGAISKSRLGSAQTAHQHCSSCHSILYNPYIPLVYYHSLHFVFHYPYFIPYYTIVVSILFSIFPRVAGNSGWQVRRTTTRPGSGPCQILCTRMYVHILYIHIHIGWEPCKKKIETTTLMFVYIL